ncbi:MAG: SpoIIE family protein phosphatase [Ilumatobacteraceae bacterium]
MDELWLREATGDAIDAIAVIDELPRAIIVTTADGRIVLWNRQAEQLYGWERGEVLGRQISEVLIALPDREQADEILGAVRAGEMWSGDFTVVRRDGETVRVWVIDRPIRDASGNTVAIVGASEAIAEQRLLEQRAADLTEHLRLALEAGGLGTFRWDMANGATEWDAKLESLFGLEPGGFDGQFETWANLLHPEDRAAVMAAVEHAVATKESYVVEHRVVWPDGTVRWLHGAGQVTTDRSGNVTGTIGCTRDVTEQMLGELGRRELTANALAAAEQERIHRERLQFLAGINDALAASRDRRELMSNVARAAVPRLGDWCAFYALPDDGGAMPAIEIAHSDPAMVMLARDLQEKYPYDPNATTGMAHVIRTGTAEFHPVIDDALLDDLETTEAERDLIRALLLGSSIAVPLIKRGRVLGGLQLVMSTSSRQYNSDDLLLAEAVASRIASSLDNLRLSEAQRSIASTLQASLLPDTLPAVPGVDVAVRYWATGEGVDVGGDFYDVFPISADEWGIVVGDVCGTGPIAASVTGMARHTIASAAWHGDTPEQVLHNLNRAMRARGVRPFCTVTYGTLRSMGDGIRLTFACAGHPLPVVTRADGSAGLFGEYGMLIGVFDDISVATSILDLGAGDGLVLYTDGITDVAPPHALTDNDLVALVSRAAARTTSADELADVLEAELAAILPLAERHDDIALLVLRVPL